MSKGIILLGTNLGDKSLNLSQAVEELGKLVEVLAQSSIYETPAWGYESNASYFNQGLLVQFSQNPTTLLRNCLNVEKKLGRIRNGQGYADRTMDIDLLLVDDIVENTEELILPHPRLELRNFALYPMFDLWPDWMHPVLKKDVKTLLEECPDEVVPDRK